MSGQQDADVTFGSSNNTGLRVQITVDATGDVLARIMATGYEFPVASARLGPATTALSVSPGHIIAVLHEEIKTGRLGS